MSQQSPSVPRRASFSLCWQAEVASNSGRSSVVAATSRNF